jgi:predicted Zn-dependent protease
MRSFFASLLIATCLLPVACTSGSGTTRPRNTLTPAQMHAEVRRVGQNGNELEVQPLRDPQVEDLLAQAEAAQSQSQWNAAEQALARVLEISPGDPEFLQRQAELALLRREWNLAEQRASASFATGPKLGGLCRRNWLTIAFAREARGDQAGAGVARDQGGRCIVAPPPRY